MKTCDHINCNEKATVSGFIYGHVRGTENKDSFISVNACEIHGKIDGFFIDRSIEETK